MNFKDTKEKIRIKKTFLYLVSACALLAFDSLLAPAFLSQSRSSAATLQTNLRIAAEEISEHADAKAAVGISVSLILLGRAEEFETGQVLLISLAGASAIAAGLKYAVNRRRPTPPTTRDNASFPSGHATASFAAAAVAAHAYPRLAVPAYCAAGAVAYSRLYLRRHYPTDIVAGALIGIAAARLVIRYTDLLTIEGRGLVGAFIEGGSAGLVVHF